MRNSESPGKMKIREKNEKHWGAGAARRSTRARSVRHRNFVGQGRTRRKIHIQKKKGAKLPLEGRDWEKNSQSIEKKGGEGAKTSRIKSGKYSGGR